MSGDDSEWWPGAPDPGNMVRNPAFTVQRLQKGIVEGGDWVRGSTSLDPNVFKTAVRFSSGADEASRELPPGTILLYARPYDYSTVEIVWGIPSPGTFREWSQIVITRSAFGYPSTVNDGQVIYRETFDTLFPVRPGYPEGGYEENDDGIPVKFTVAPIYDANAPPPTNVKPRLASGRWYYYSLFFLFNVEWTRATVASTLLPRNHGHTEHLWNTLPPYYRWTDNQRGMMMNEGTPAMGDLHRWLHIFGFELDTTKEYVDSWQDLYHVDFAPGNLLRKLGENFGQPFEAGIGDIRYRGLLAELGALFQIRGTTRCLERLVCAASKFECDITVSPNLLTHADDSDFFEGTGHWAGLHPNTDEDDVVGEEAVDVVILSPESVRFTPDPTHFRVGGVGRSSLRIWTTKSSELDDILLTCGDGVSYDYWLPPAPDEGSYISAREIYPRSVGILVDPGVRYGFSVQVDTPATTEVEVVIMWFDVTGMPTGLLSVSTSGLTTMTGGWRRFTVKGDCPDEAHYAVPGIWFTSRVAGPGEAPEDMPLYVDSPLHVHSADKIGLGGVLTVSDGIHSLGSRRMALKPLMSPDMWITEAAFYQLSTPPPPPGLDRLLLVGDASMRMGLPIATPPVTTPQIPTPYLGYVIGEPPTQ